ncbi:hypothetical protein F441_06153 [Phytophthora nicotianae CJ01A1]|uniref:Uncharacterized protein n=3 Tax=Phytophthora nicotianae TaxID=4792 RepID=W2XBY5_PHYNI|nr:hypothetical protein L915_13645 [Phytophthora nicotianae]ETO77667.1 hypothetical protein F444_07167 [Phytophthora nicotianae P1976]ETP20022.1 hypothetical protein F441_06153 [Phytophthora nicotianae CJ01A1]
MGEMVNYGSSDNVVVHMIHFAMLGGTDANDTGPTIVSIGNAGMQAVWEGNLSEGDLDMDAYVSSDSAIAVNASDRSVHVKASLEWRSWEKGGAGAGQYLRVL